MAAQGLSIVPVRTKAELERFVRVPMRLNARDPAWIAPLVSERIEAFSPDKNPFFDHADVQMWLAVRDGVDVGRISAQLDHLAPQDDDALAGAFGLIAAEDDAEVFAALFTAAEAWLKAQQVDVAVGPFNLSINEEVGLLVDGFETPPMVMMGHDPPYAAARIEALGYAKVKDVYAYAVDITEGASLAAVARASRDPAGSVTLRKLDMGRYDAEVATLTEILNDAWSGNWGFTPTTEAETRALARSLRQVVEPRLIWFAEIDGKPVACLIALPNINEAIADLDGELMPFGWAKLLWRLKVRGLKTLRVPLMGVRRNLARSLRGRMLPFQLIGAVAAEAQAMGYERAEFSWILEDNTAMRRICEARGATRYKTYRLYRKALA
jgi:hypothetical protein